MGDVERRPPIIRTEERVSINIEAELEGSGAASEAEPVVVQNASSHGARVLTRKFYEPGERLVLRTRHGQRLARARVIYVQPCGRRYAVGLELNLATKDWLPPFR
ncbi:MAG: PilZ domain-containing protein [Terriglobales bacterium]